MFFILNRRSWDFKPFVEKAKPTSVDSSSDKPKALIRNIASQPLGVHSMKESSEKAMEINIEVKLNVYEQQYDKIF